MGLASHVLHVKNVVFTGHVFVVWINLPAIETCILVEIDLQVYISARKVGFTGPKVYFFSYFVVCIYDKVVMGFENIEVASMFEWCLY